MVNTDTRYIIWLLDFLSSLGMDTNTIAANNGISRSELHKPNVLINAKQHRGLLTDAQQCYEGSDLGLILGLKRSIATHDQLAYLMMSSATLRDASHIGLKYQNYSGRFSGNLVVTSFSEIQAEGCYQIDAKTELGELRVLAIEDLLANIVTTCRWVLGQALPITKLRCNYPAPVHAERYQAIFNCPVEFDAPVTQLFFDAAILDQRLPQSSPESVNFYKKLCEEKSITRNHGDIAWRLSQIIVEDPASPPSLHDAALKLHCSCRTLSRKLLAQGWRYQQLIDQVREIHARRHLSDPTLSITRIGQQLGYADSSGFHRAFKKWTGLSPSAFRHALFAVR
ncbi:AraC family transcriptional regulator [Pseudoalteromonas sp. NZS127]|uniref:AraC family transcriptional regulator n=1 Tax=unclassified Pseudoalteromonas TaxID=194690 RepID=UPI0018CF2AAB|nr:AraC family transcriptional regulator [Pseudoalteromonas sp. NZS127]MBH0071433.1 AraC family transcriptional regulator [Pseudoalteromonas sp. NZS127]|tara:strand:+ start:39284 stop:40300 length:1017 start_codon:yes stop_codon:yes gene_type:complete